MKSKANLLLSIIGGALFSAQIAQTAPLNPVTGLPVTTGSSLINPASGLPARGDAPLIDPASGLPVPSAPAIPDWKDSNWKDPDIVLANVDFSSGLPLSEVVHYIREQFHGQFDILTPGVDGGLDISAIQVTLQLKNVTATELFNAMNMTFENDRTPVRWQLKLNGKRQVALLRVLADFTSPALPVIVPGIPTVRRVYFVGDLIGDEKSGGMTMDQIIKTVQDVWKTTYNEPAALQFHKDAQLLIVSGGTEQIAFVEDILNALKQKAAIAKKETASAREAARADAVRDAMAKQMIDNTKTTNLKPAAK